MQISNKHRISLRILTAMAVIWCILLAAAAAPAVTALADEAITVEGTVTDKTTDSMLYLSTSGGLMIIKIDSSTDLTGCKMLLPDKKVRVTCARQNDEYLHASRITAVVQPSSSTASSISGAVTVHGRVVTGTTDTILKLDTGDGQTMLLKVDGNTNWDGCRCLTVGKSVYVTTARGSDAYMHALVISDTAPASNNSSSASDIASQISGNSVKGIVTKDTTAELLQLNTSGGLMKIKLDASTDLTGCKALVTGREVAVGWVRGNDAYLHATKIVGVRKAENAASVDTASAVTVQGKVTNETTENILYLDTSAGRMAIKLDPSTVMNCRVLTENANINVSVARGSDAYMHAVKIDPVGSGQSAPSSSAPSPAVTPTGDTIIVQGTVNNDTTENTLSLKTSGGDMLIRIDVNTNLSICKALITGDTVAVACYRGSDAYFHASAIVGTVQPGNATVDSTGAVTVVGTVAAGTNGGLLCLDSSGGAMQIKLDAATKMGSCRVLTLGRSVKVSVVRGSDAYMHAVAIDAN